MKMLAAAWQVAEERAQHWLGVQIKNDVAGSIGHSTSPEISFTCGEAIGNGIEVWFHPGKIFQS